MTTKIAFCHNVYNRFDCLLDTIRIEKELFPNSVSVVAYNAQSPKDFFENAGIFDVYYHPFNGSTHKIGCANGCIKSVQEALVHNPVVIIFSHDDVRIAKDKLSVINENIELIVNDTFDAICRKPTNSELGNEYYMMEVFYISRKGAEQVFQNLKLFNNENDISTDKRGSISPEVFLYKILKSGELRILEKEYYNTLAFYNSKLESALGYNHEMAGQRGWSRQTK